jgi:hypothetical protein
MVSDFKVPVWVCEVEQISETERASEWVSEWVQASVCAAVAAVIDDHRLHTRSTQGDIKMCNGLYT